MHVPHLSSLGSSNDSQLHFRHDATDSRAIATTVLARQADPTRR